MIKASDFVPAVISAYEHGDGYILGKYGQLCTEAMIRAGSKQNNDQTQKYGRRWIGHIVWDCSGLPYAKAKALGYSIPHGANSIWNSCLKEKGKASDYPPSKRLPGMAVFLTSGSNRHHIGTYVGGGLVVEAKGTRWGVVVSRFEDWDEAGYYKGVENDLPVDYVPTFDFYENDPADLPVLKKGDNGPEVHFLQVMLRQHFGYDLTVDNAFGASTEKSVKDFQQKHELWADGAVGVATWSALAPDTVRRIAEKNAADKHSESAGTVSATNAADRATIRKGSRGDDVFWLQQSLAKLGYIIGIDGAFGPGTQECVKNFQQEHGLADDGVCGPLTWAMLDKATKEVQKHTPSPTPDNTDLDYIQAPENYDPEDEDMVLIPETAFLNDPDPQDEPEDQKGMIMLQVMIVQTELEKLRRMIGGDSIEH